MQVKIVTPSAPPAGTSPHSQAIATDNLIFTQGSIYLTPEGKLLEGTVAEQVDQIMKNLSAILKAAGVTFANIVKTTIYVTDLSIYGTVNEIYKKYMVEPYLARETVCVRELSLGAKVEISMIAVK